MGDARGSYPAGDTAIALLKEGADHSIKNSEDMLPLHLAPDEEVNIPDTHTLDANCLLLSNSHRRCAAI